MLHRTKFRAENFNKDESTKKNIKSFIFPYLFHFRGKSKRDGLAFSLKSSRIRKRFEEQKLFIENDKNMEMVYTKLQFVSLIK
jgi:hypothetical protein